MKSIGKALSIMSLPLAVGGWMPSYSVPEESEVPSKTCFLNGNILLHENLSPQVIELARTCVESTRGKIRVTEGRPMEIAANPKGAFDLPYEDTSFYMKGEMPRLIFPFKGKPKDVLLEKTGKHRAS